MSYLRKEDVGYVVHQQALDESAHGVQQAGVKVSRPPVVGRCLEHLVHHTRLGIVNT